MKTRLLVFIVAVILSYSIASAQWLQSDGPFGGPVLCLASSAIDLYAGTFEGLYRSTDNGANWMPVNSGLKNFHVRALLINGTDLYAGTGSYGTDSTGGVYRSTDRGTTWSAVNNGLPANPHITSLAFRGSELFTGTTVGLFHSTDQGSNWTLDNGGLWATSWIDALSTGGTNLFAVAGGEVFCSSSIGAPWTGIATPYPGVQPTFFFASAGSGYFAYGPYGFERSTDNGSSWTLVDSGSTWKSLRALVAQDASIFVGTANGVFRSTDEGASWWAADSGVAYRQINTLALSGNRLVAGTGGSYDQAPFADGRGGVFVSTDHGTSWIASGLNAGGVYSLAADGATVWAGTALSSYPGDYGGGAFVSTDNGTGWAKMNTGLPNTPVFSLVAAGSSLFAGTGLGVYKSTNRGGSWTLTSSGVADSSVSSLVASGGNLFAGTYGRGVVRSTNEGSSWSTANNGLTNLHVRSLAVSGTTLLAGIYEYIDPLQVRTGIFRSTDSGANWNELSVSWMSRNVSSFAVTGAGLFAGTHSGVYRSTDAGASWIESDSGMVLSGGVTSLVASGTILFAGMGDSYLPYWNTGGGVFLSTNGGSTWAGVGMNDLVVHSLALSKTHVYAGTAGAGVWVRPLSELVSSVQSWGKGIPQAFELYQNYPNPFNPTTEIQYTIHDRQSTSIKIFDLLGREVASLVNEVKAPGQFSVTWNASGWASGVYFCRMRAGEFVQTIRLMLLK